MDFEPELLGADTYAAITRNRGTVAQKWVDDLPRLASETQRRFGLVLGPPFTDGRSACVLAARCGDGRPAVLKLAPPWHGVERELLALYAWGGVGAPAVIAADAARGLLVMERVVPGETVSEMDSHALAELSGRVHLNVPVASFPSVQDEIARRVASREAALATMSASAIAVELDVLALADARRWAGRLADGKHESFLCHGDFYGAKNILRCERRGPLVIDPFPCLGEREYDFAMWVNTAATSAAGSITLVQEIAAELALDGRRLMGYAALLAGAQLCGTADGRRPGRERLWRTLSSAAEAIW